jgi:hypothetical protein
MSEYQYYEFLAVDRPLDERQMAELRKLSSRAEITATRFTNEYSWGDFRGDPHKLMEQYFDAFLYLANWGTHHLMFRLPRTLLELKEAEQYCYTDAAAVRESGDHLIPPGLASLSAPLRAVADFLRIDQDLLHVAASISPPLEPLNDADDSAAGLTTWLSSLPPQEKDSLLAQVAEGKGSYVQALLLRRFQASTSAGTASAASTASAVSSRRTAGQLLDEADTRQAAREEAEAEQARQKAARQAAKAVAAYQKRLDELATRVEPAWAQVSALIDTKSQRDYDEAVALLKDLRALAERQGDPASFTQRFLPIRAQHQRKPSLIARFDAAQLPR